MKPSKNTKNEDENPSQVRVTSRELIISSKEIISNNAKCRKQILKFLKHLKVLEEWNWWWNFTCVGTISHFWHLFSLDSIRYCFWWYLWKLFISLAFRKCKKDCNILDVILVLGSCPLKTEITGFSIGFRLKLFIWRRANCSSKTWRQNLKSLPQLCAWVTNYTSLV